MPVIAAHTNASARGYGWSATIPESLDGMILVAPTSVVSSGTGNSSNINANGSVTFDSCTNLSLNGVFTPDYDNYLLSIRSTHSGTSIPVSMRLRASGTDNSTASSYVFQSLSANSTTVAGSRTTGNAWTGFNEYANLKVGVTIYLFGPYLSQATAIRSLSFEDISNASIWDIGATHNQSTAYDGFSFIAGLAISGTVSVYGLEN